MTMRYQNKTVILADVVGVEDAEELLGMLQKYPTAKLDMEACTHVHTACLQVLMAVKPAVKKWPEVPVLAHWLRLALKQ